MRGEAIILTCLMTFFAGMIIGMLVQRVETNHEQARPIVDTVQVLIGLPWDSLTNLPECQLLCAQRAWMDSAGVDR